VKPSGFWAQAGRFLVVGGIAAGVDFGLLWVLMAVGLNHVTAKALSWLAGTATAYIGNRRWTFRAPPSGQRLVAVAGLYGTTFLVQVALFAGLYPPLARWWGRSGAQVTAFVIAQAVATVTNFIVQRWFIFGPPRGQGNEFPPGDSSLAP
jgi:putative flippase GtrA